MSRSNPKEDRISALPNPIIWHILSFLPTKTAAITSILSKRWNPLWLSVLILHFEDETFQNMESFSHFMSSVFLLRDITLPLRSFHLKCSKASGIQPQDINRFVHAYEQWRSHVHSRVCTCYPSICTIPTYYFVIFTYEPPENICLHQIAPTIPSCLHCYYCCPNLFAWVD
ncbi:putative F-box domain-containing protein [Medicago truncatula]|uniref:Putative F-box domain-containing protein n=1 Tax=Medicago truncatula TaxID=3880 RepID=A0A396GZG1_MEDTR|nr:putative F-box domain-containing protein [Medicago truncatula]RHN45868.1 putative F-box domain-containing protein [Medicago truncatula]RHN45872.1 putative F-box domain-containing protein [Medicago truncatula]